MDGMIHAQGRGVVACPSQRGRCMGGGQPRKGNVQASLGFVPAQRERLEARQHSEAA